jgi:uncharacterized Zn-finger protein
MGAIVAKPSRSSKPGESMEAPAQPLETIVVEEQRVACDGGGGALGHPKVYLNLGPKGRIECPYCGRLYVLKAGAGARTGHGH